MKTFEVNLLKIFFEYKVKNLDIVFTVKLEKRRNESANFEYLKEFFIFFSKFVSSLLKYFLGMFLLIL